MIHSTDRSAIDYDRRVVSTEGEIIPIVVWIVDDVGDADTDVLAKEVSLTELANVNLLKDLQFP